MTRLALALIASLMALPAAAEEAAPDAKATSCGYQAEVVAAVQQARKDRVAEREVTDHVLAADPTWPENFNNSIPLIAAWVYEQKRRDIRRQDLSAIWNELCLQVPDDALN
ncbi:MAG: hypothetical protein AAFY52_07900 [Pseudomonadota bacterium]